MPKFYDFKVFTKHDLKLCILCQTLSHFNIKNIYESEKVASKPIVTERDWNTQCREGAICLLQDQKQAITEACQKMGHLVLPSAPGTAVYVKYQGSPRILPPTLGPKGSPSFNRKRP